MPRSKRRRAKDRQRQIEERAIARAALAQKRQEKIQESRARTVRQDLG